MIWNLGSYGRQGSWETGKKLWQTHSESNERSTESEAALQKHFHFLLELIIELGRVGLTTSQVTIDITWKIVQKCTVEAAEPS